MAVLNAKVTSFGYFYILFVVQKLYFWVSTVLLFWKMEIFINMCTDESHRIPQCVTSVLGCFSNITNRNKIIEKNS